MRKTRATLNIMYIKAFFLLTNMKERKKKKKETRCAPILKKKKKDLCGEDIHSGCFGMGGVLKLYFIIFLLFS